MIQPKEFCTNANVHIIQHIGIYLCDFAFLTIMQMSILWVIGLRDRNCFAWPTFCAPISWILLKVFNIALAGRGHVGQYAYQFLIGYDNCRLIGSQSKSTPKTLTIVQLKCTEWPHLSVRVETPVREDINAVIFWNILRSLSINFYMKE